MSREVNSDRDGFRYWRGVRSGGDWEFGSFGVWLRGRVVILKSIDDCGGGGGGGGG